MSVDDDIWKILNDPPPVRRFVIGWPRYAAYYKVGQSWIAFVRLPNGIIHLAHWKWWGPLRLMPKALWLHFWRMRKADVERER